jgi:periplasmic protein CpxP/Spy
MPLTMNLPSLRLALVAGLALPLGLASASLAQTAPAPAAPAAAGMHHPWRDHAAVDPAARRAHMAEHLTAVLQLQPSQQSALATFVDSMKPPENAGSGDIKGRMDHARGEADRLPTPQRLDKMLARFDEMHARMVARVEATKLFYAQLSPSQQKAFDDLAPMMMRHHGGGHHGMMGHRHAGGGPGHEMGHEMGPGGPPPG